MNDEELKRQLRAMVENAAAPVSSAKAMLRASSPSRKSRRDWHLTEHRLIVVAVAAAIVVVFFVPLPHASLFHSLVTPAKVTAPTKLPLVDLSATPAGWVPVADGDVQISVPATWWVLYNSSGCESGSKVGTVFINPSGGYCGIKGIRKTETTVVLKPAPRYKNPAKYGQRQVHNRIVVYELYSFAPTAIPGTYLIPSLGVEIEVAGPLAKRVIDTLTRSPRTVVLAAGPAPAVPSSWQLVSYDGIAFSVPATWSISRTIYAIGIGGGCAATPGVAMGMWDANEVLLSTDKHLAVISCPTGIPQHEVPADGLQIDSGPYQPTFPVRTKCFVLHGLTVCPATAYPYSVLVLKVTVPGRTKPAIVSIGLAGNGMISRTILYSLRPAQAPKKVSVALCTASSRLSVFNFGGSVGNPGEALTGIGISNESSRPCVLRGRPVITLYVGTKRLAPGEPEDSTSAFTKQPLVTLGKPRRPVSALHTYSAVSAGFIIATADFAAAGSPMVCPVVTSVSVRLPGIESRTFQYKTHFNACDVPPPISVSNIVDPSVLFSYMVVQ
jgi:hypothetical protein